MIAIKSDYFKRYLVEPRRFERLPPDWSEIFGREGELVVEIGFGSGEFLEELAASNPDKNFIGFELSLISMEKAQKRFFRRGLENVRVVLVDGRFGMRELFHDGTVSKVISNFPCPWPRKKHQKRRLIVPEFARILAAVLKEGGDFELVTDELWFAEEAAERFDETGCFRIEGPIPDPERPIQTRYERKWKSLGKTIYLTRFIKVRGMKVERIAGGDGMPHYFVDREVTLEELQKLVGLKYERDDSVFVLKEVYASPKGDRFLIRAFASDAGFQQQYFLIVRKAGGRWLVKLDGASLPYKTTAVKFSVYKVGRALQGEPLDDRWGRISYENAEEVDAAGDGMV